MGEDAEMRLTKIAGWDTRMAQYIHENFGRTFDRGEFDCRKMVCEILFDITGFDFGKDWEGKYSNDNEAKEMLESLGPDSFFRLCDDTFSAVGWEKVNWKLAHRGDPVFFESKKDPWAGCLAICGGQHAWTPTEKGLTRLPMKLARMAWKIPYV